MTATTAQPSQVRRDRRIIERPRLIKMLDETDARVILLLAPAGYGKTTLARQWAKTLNGAIWVSLTPAHRDVATLADDIAEGIDRLGGKSRPYLTDYLKAQSNPQRVARRVARALAKELVKSRVHWLVLDDFHEASSPQLDDVVSLLLEETGLRLLICTRVRPAWATARKTVYGELTEVDRDVLAMDSDETASFLGRRPDLQALADQAQGWPALLALARARPDAPTPSTNVPSALHRFFAEELFQSVEPGVQEQLLLLSLFPTLDGDDVATILDNEQRSRLLEVVSDLGFVTGDAEPYIHPLVREFLWMKLSERANAVELAREQADRSLERGEWDHAFAVISRFQLDSMADRLIAASYKPLVVSGRVGSLAMYADYNRRRASSESDLVDAEVALRDGDYRFAAELAHRTHDSLDERHALRSRAALIEGAAAFQLAEVEWSERNYEIALSEAREPFDRTEALHGLAIAAIYGERPSADSRVEALRIEAERDPTPLNVVRHASSALARARIGGALSGTPYLQDAIRVLQHVPDPRARTSAMVVIGYSLGLQCEYARAEVVTNQMLAECERYDLEFAKPHGLWNLAFVKAGMRQYTDANRILQTIEESLRGRHHAHHALNAAALRARILLQLGKPGDALICVQHNVPGSSSPSMHAEYLATRALALQLLGEPEEAEAVACTAEDRSTSSEVAVLIAAVRAIDAARGGDASRAEGLTSLAQMKGVWDPALCALRSSPALAVCLARHPSSRPQLQSLYAKTQDVAMARRAGMRTPNRAKPTSELLSPRELEVLDLLAQGFRNKDIARAFVISESTVKVHVVHIFEKLGVRSRAQAVARFLEES